MLYIVATPIGNLKDITLRALEVLKNVDLILCEDTRVTQKLLSHFSISKKLMSYHKFSEKEKVEEVISLLKEGKEIALVSDAGTPLISDPGSVLVQRVREERLPITSLPGACGVITALTLSSLDTAHFAFIGFVNKMKKKEIESLIQNLKMTMAFYVTPNSYEKDIATLHEILGNRKACLCRELTKRYEQALTFELKDCPKESLKGEMVLIVEGKREDNFSSLTEGEHLRLYLSQGMEKNEAIKKVAKERKVPKNEIYKLLNKG